MKRSTRILAVVGAVVALVLVLLLVLPFLFRDRIAARVKTEVNQSVDARVDWRDVGLSFFRDFPNLTAAARRPHRRRRPAVRGRHARRGPPPPGGPRPGQRAAERPGGSGPIVVRAVELDQPRLPLIGLEDGTANWDITKSQTTGRQTPSRSRWRSASGSFDINDGAVVFDNRTGKAQRVARRLRPIALAATSARIWSPSRPGPTPIRSASPSPASRTSTVSGSISPPTPQADLAEEVLHPQEQRAPPQRPQARRLRLRRLGRQALGPGPRLHAPSTNFRSILSLVPAVYAHDFDKVKTSGTFAVSARLRATTATAPSRRSR